MIRRPLVFLALSALFTLAVVPTAWGHNRVDHIVVIYQENHSFDNLYGGWEGVDGLARADAAHTTQVDQAGAPYACLPQNDVNIAPACPPNASSSSAPTPARCSCWTSWATCPPTRPRTPTSRSAPSTPRT